MIIGLVLASCAASDKASRKARELVGVAQSGSVRTAAKIVTSRDPQAAVGDVIRERGSAYARDPTKLARDLRDLQRDYERLVQLLSGNVEQRWGPREVKLPSRTQYVKYTQNYQSRAEVDFDGGLVTVETVDETATQRSLESAIVTTLLTPSDPRSVDLFSDRAVPLTGDAPPYLRDLVRDHRGRPVTTPEEAQDFAGHLWREKRGARDVQLPSGTRRATYVQIRMVPNFEGRQAEAYRPLVERYAQRYRVSPSLVFAIIRTESNFNPFAVSAAPAYGLMQLVPSSGGRDAVRKVKGTDEMPTRETLLDPERNIELGTAYLAVLAYEQLDGVSAPAAREYCVISAYNTGPGNVLRSFARGPAEAFAAINALQPPGVYQHLREHLPYEETRQYLLKVVGYRKAFVLPTD